MKENSIVAIIIASSVFLLFYGIDSLSIRYDEAYIFYKGESLVHYLVQAFVTVFGQNDFALRLPFVLLHVASLVLLYKIGKLFLKRKLDRVISVGIYALLPGVNSAALVVNSAYVVIFLTLLFVALYMYGHKKYAYMVLLLTLLVENSFVILYFTLFFYAIAKKEKTLLWFSLTLFTIGMYMYGFDTGGKPKGYFLDTFGVYAAIFSPLLFLYFIYAMYRILIKEEKNILWFISFGTLVLSLLLSLRQRLMLEDFAPFVVIAVPLMVKIFFNSYRVRLPQHRKYHNIAFGVVLSLLLANLGLSYVNKPLYYLVKQPDGHFAYEYHVAKDLAQALKKKGIRNVKTRDKELALRLRFYGINGGGIYELSLTSRGKEDVKYIDIEYFGKRIKRYYLHQ